MGEIPLYSKGSLHHSVEYSGFDPEVFRGVRDRICTTFGPTVNFVRQVDF